MQGPELVRQYRRQWNGTARLHNHVEVLVQEAHRLHDLVIGDSHDRFQVVTQDRPGQLAQTRQQAVADGVGAVLGNQFSSGQRASGIVRTDRFSPEKPAVRLCGTSGYACSCK